MFFAREPVRPWLQRIKYEDVKTQIEPPSEEAVTSVGNDHERSSNDTSNNVSKVYTIAR